MRRKDRTGSTRVHFVPWLALFFLTGPKSLNYGELN
nr:MAG TPA: hypothetical protein [Caudoviricetes sp.]